MNELPIYGVIDELKHKLNSSDKVILEAEPGAGKTTVVPLELMQEEWLEEQLIVMLEPRRVAARAAAERMAASLNEPCGQQVGYRIRQENRSSVSTRILVVTEGVLTRWLQQDPSLEGVGLVIFDEFHERNLESDLGLALSLQCQSLLRDEGPALKLLLMSATLNSQVLSHFLNDAPTVQSQGRSYPVEIHYYPHTIKRTYGFAEAIAQACFEALSKNEGNCLVFLPGQREIRDCLSALNSLLQSKNMASGFELLPLHGGLSLEEQRRAIEPLSQQAQQSLRKVVLATDIAETSLTIDGISLVIDSGLHRSAQYDARNAMSRLHTQRISKASAIQRAGRAGRLGPGSCWRLWPEDEQSSLVEHSQAEILQADLCNFALQLFSWGLQSPSELELLDQPREGMFQQAVDLLQKLEAIDEHNKLTPQGQTMAKLPCHPRFAYMLLRAAQHQCLSEAALLAAVLSENRRPNFAGADLQALLNELQLPASTHSKKQAANKQIQGFRYQIKQQQKRFISLCKGMQAEYDKPIEAMAFLLACAFPDRIAKLQNLEQGSYKLSNGRRASLATNEALSASPYIVIAELGGHAEQSVDRIYAAIELPELLLKNELKALCHKQHRFEWQADQDRFIALKESYVGALLIGSEQQKKVSDEQRREALLNFIRKQGLHILNWDDGCINLQARAELLKHKASLLAAFQLESKDWPSFTESDLLQELELWLAPSLTKVKRLSELKKIKLEPLLKQRLNWAQQSALNELCPERIGVASGNQYSIDYSQSPPVLACKLQEMFGWQQGPSILKGQLPLMLHLLSPAQRPLQITQDLVGFWQNSYEQVKKEMRGRYPKHPWPDDPVQAQATRFTKKRSGQQ
ncbi:ATP-dependent helicase HrpB [Agaribacterium sp. ZY112]|uniref:ATP-dependent helicase HrpB n=1 Tax=Agaribacterium sp. ZY112 TaxID=3233574 RepID=UPI003523F98D